jgi:hypothetical protein
MAARLKKLGVVVAVFGLLFIIAGGFAAYQVKQGSDALRAFSAAQDVKLSYDENGHLTDHGSAEEADAILSLLENDWNYPVDKSELDPNDPIVNTASEYMYQMATIAHHVLTSTVKVTLTEPAEVDGKTLEPGTYDVPVDGKYYSQFDRTNPLEGGARGQAWSATALSLQGQLGVGAATASTLKLGWGVAAVIAGLGGTLLVAGLGLVWVAGAPSVSEAKPAPKKAPAKSKK